VAGAARKAQILIYRLYLQGAAVERATKRVDAAKSALPQSEAQNRRAAEELKTYEEMRNSLDDAARRKQLEDVIPRFKTNLEASLAEQQELKQRKLRLRRNCGSSRRNSTGYKGNSSDSTKPWRSLKRIPVNESVRKTDASRFTGS